MSSSSLYKMILNALKTATDLPCYLTWLDLSPLLTIRVDVCFFSFCSLGKKLLVDKKLPNVVFHCVDEMPFGCRLPTHNQTRRWCCDVFVTEVN